jgi:hypothetical protein
MLTFLRLLFARHDWEYGQCERRCKVCGRVDLAEEYDDPHGPSMIWAPLQPGVMARYLGRKR